MLISLHAGRVHSLVLIQKNLWEDFKCANSNSQYLSTHCTPDALSILSFDRSAWCVFIAILQMRGLRLRDFGQHPDLKREALTIWALESHGLDSNLNSPTY